MSSIGVNPWRVVNIPKDPISASDHFVSVVPKPKDLPKSFKEALSEYVASSSFVPLFNLQHFSYKGVPAILILNKDNETLLEPFPSLYLESLFK